MTTIIKKDGKKIVELCIENEIPFIGCCAIVKRYENGTVHTIISAEEYASILDGAEEDGCDIFDYYD